MATLTGKQIENTYPGLLKTSNESALDVTTEKTIEDGLGNASTLTMSQTSASFSGTLDLSAATVNGLPAAGGFAPTTVSGATQSLDLSQFNFFDAGELTTDTTVTFDNTPTEKRFTYTAKINSIPYAIAEAKKIARIDIGTINSSLDSVIDISFNNNGNKLYVLKGEANGDAIYELNLSTAYDITTATYSGVNLDLQPQNLAVEGLKFKADGTAFYMIGNYQADDKIYEYTLTTAFDLSTATFANKEFDLSTQTSRPTDVEFNPTGDKMYILGYENRKIYQYTLSTPFDVTTAVYDNIEFNVSTQTTLPRGLAFNNDGTSIFVSDGGTLKIYEYTLATAYDLSSASYANISFATNSSSVRGLYFRPDGYQFFVAGKNGINSVMSFNTEVISVTFPNTVENPPTYQPNVGDILTFTFNTIDGGTTYTFEKVNITIDVEPGLVAGGGTNSIASANITTTAAAATGNNSIAIGNASTAIGNDNIVLGSNSISSSNVINIGNNNDAGDFVDNTILIRQNGGTALAFRGNSVAIGLNTYPGAGGVAIGNNARANANQPNIVIGRDAEVTQNGISIGNLSFARNTNSIALGVSAETTANGAAAIGNNVIGAKVDTVSVKELETQTPGGGVILTTPDGNAQYKLTIDNSGNLVTTII